MGADKQNVGVIIEDVMSAIAMMHIIVEYHHLHMAQSVSIHKILAV